MESPNKIEIDRASPLEDFAGEAISSKPATALIALADRFARSNVRYCVLHGWSRLPAWSSGDFDMAIAPEQLEIIDNALENDCGGQIVQLLQHEKTGFFFVARCDGEKDFVLVDAATDYRRDSRIFFSSDELLDGARDWNGFKVAAPEVEYAYLLVKKISKRSIGSHQQDRLAELHDAIGPEASRIAVTLLGETHGKQVDGWIGVRQWDEFGRQISTLRKVLKRTVLRRDPLNAVRYWMSDIGRRLNRWRNPSGLLVAIMGPDGAGKSTLIAGLDRILGSAFRHTDSFHLRPAILKSRGDGPPVTDPHGMPPRSTSASVAKVAFYAAEYVLGYALRLKPALGHTTLIFADRYFDDLMIDPRRYRYGGPASLLRLTRRIIPKPDLWLFLDVPEEQLLGRKSEVSLEEARRQRAAYRELAAETRNAVVIDGSCEAPAVVAQAAEAAIDHLHARYRSRRFKWLPHAHEEDLKWLGGVALNPDFARFESASEKGGGWRDSGDCFRWLRLGDGRGFLFPDDDAIAAKTLDLYNAHSVKGRIVKSILGNSTARKTPRILRKVAVQYRNGPAPVGGDKTIFELIRRTLDKQDLSFAVSLGTPGPHRKPVLQVVARDGSTVAFAKVGASAATNVLLKNEAATLTRLSNLEGLSFTVPRLLSAIDWNAHSINLQSSPATTMQAASDDFSAEYLAVIDQLSAIDRTDSTIVESSFWRGLVQRVRAIRHPYYRHLLERVTQMIAERFGAQSMAFHFSHGDLAPWNIRRVDGRLYIFDWEYAARDTPAGWDIFHFFVQTLSLLKGYSAGQIWREFSASGTAARWANASLDHLSMSRDLLQPALLLYLTGQLAVYADARDADVDKLRRIAMMLSVGLGELEHTR
jgi:thymidylate kinase